MISIFTTSKEEFDKATLLAEYLKKNLCEDISISVNLPCNSYAVTVFSVEEVINELENYGVNTENIPDELLIECIEELGLPGDIQDRIVSAGNETISSSLDEILALLNKKGGKCHHNWEDIDDVKKECASCGKKSSPDDFICSSCKMSFSTYDLEIDNGCPFCGSTEFAPGSQKEAENEHLSPLCV